MPVDPRTPVLIGAGQFTRRPQGAHDAVDAVDLMTEAVRRSLEGLPSAARALELMVCVAGDWPLADPARVVGERLGLPDPRTAITRAGGNMPQHAISEIGERIGRGQLDLAVVMGGENGYSKRLRGEPPFTTKRLRADALPGVAQGVPPDEQIGAEVQWWTDFERTRGLLRPLHAYALVESALTAAAELAPVQHRERVASLWQRFNQVAVTNPHAWSREPLTADEIMNGGPATPMTIFPYTRAQVSNPFVDQAAAVVLCSAERARQAGVPADRWVFLHGSATAHDSPDFLARDRLDRSPAIAAASDRLAKLVGRRTDDIAHFDIYSCFPSAVQVALAELKLGWDRPLTVTGGLTFAGGPHNNYVTHSVAAMYDVLVADPGSFGLVTANGGFLTKHALAMYSSTPPAGPVAFDDVQAEADCVPRRPVAARWSGLVTIEAAVVEYANREPIRALFTVAVPGGGRTLGWSTEAAAFEAVTSGSVPGLAARLSAQGELRLGAAPAIGR